jgi:murein DD-endopeptidase MepM/ murein hydrolase activator NlpD
MTPRPGRARALLSWIVTPARAPRSLPGVLLLLAACGPGRAAPPSAPAPARATVRGFERPEGRRPAAAPAPGARLFIPVMGIRAEQLRDTYEDPRTGHVHHAIDIMAPGGTAVLAAADGVVLKLRSGGNGGITIYQLDPDGHTLYYYAHLQRYAAGLREGQSLWRGQVIAYVGDTGNAGAGNYHLHFSVGHVTDPHRWWESENVNPFPLLAGDYAHRAPTSSGTRED